MYLATAQEMNAWDTASIDMGMPAFSLMENASRELWHVLRETLAQYGQSLHGKRILILAGSGNNGGDAIALARHIHDAQYLEQAYTYTESPHAIQVPYQSQPLVVHTAPLEHYKGMAQEHVNLAIHCGVTFMSAEQWLTATKQGASLFVDVANKHYAPHIIIDGLLGTGFQGPLRGASLAVIERLQAWLEEQDASVPNQAHTSSLFHPLANHVPHHKSSQTSPFPRPYILAIDIPSGLDSMTGLPSPIAIPAHTTVTFEAPKIGLVMEAARPFVGNLVVRSIGIPHCTQQKLPTQCTLLHSNITRFLPDMNKLGHKGDAGHVLVIGGSKGLTGAAHLSAKASLRTGAGLVSMAVPVGLELEAKCGVPDIMVMGVGGAKQESLPNRAPRNHTSSTIYNDANWPSDNLQEALHDTLELAKRCGALVLGPGIGRSVEALDTVKAILSMPHRPPAIIDADALFALSHHSAIPASHVQKLHGQDAESLLSNSLPCNLPPTNPLLALVQKDDILTPHPTEAARMLGWTTAQVQADRMATLNALSKLVTGTVILKGACTLIGQAQSSPEKSLPEESSPHITVSPFIEPHLSVAGSGDVLAGIIASLVAQGVSPTNAAQLGVFLHVKTGVLLAKKFPKRGNTASDMVDMIPKALYSA